MSFMTNYSMASLAPLDDGEYYMHNETGFPHDNNSNYGPTPLCSSSECKVIKSFAFLISSFGLVGNGTVIWLLGFRMKRNPFTTFILNLAVADFGVLIYIVIDCTVYIMVLFSNANIDSRLTELLSISIFIFLNLTGQFLLTAISIDRCVSVLFPIWHKCHRPTFLSTSVCTFLWVASFLLCLTPYIIFITSLYEIVFILLAVTLLLCLPLMIISSLVLFIKVCFKSPKHKRGKALTAIFLTLMFFIIFVFPVFSSLLLMFLFGIKLYEGVSHYSFLGAALNSSVNPFIYFLVGRQKRGQRKEKMKNILQRLFKEEEGYGADMDSPV